MTMKMKWTWEWNENYLTRTRRGERKRRGKERTPTPTHLARSGRTLKRQGQGKSGGRRKRTKTSGGGGGRKRLNQPTTAKPKPTSARAGPKPTWRGEGHMKKGDQQGTSTSLMQMSWRLTCSMNSVHNWTSPDNQKGSNTTPESMACCLLNNQKQKKRLRQGETRKKADCFTLLRRITRLTCVNSEIRSKKGECPIQRAVVQHTTATMWNPKKRPTVPLYLNELLG